MKYIAVLFLFSAGLCAAAQNNDATFAVSKNKGLTCLQERAGVPPGCMLIACQLTIVNGNDVFQKYFTARQNKEACDFLYRTARWQSKVSFERMVATKDGVSVKVPDKTIVFRY